MDIYLRKRYIIRCHGARALCEKFSAMFRMLRVKYVLTLVVVTEVTSGTDMYLLQKATESAKLDDALRARRRLSALQDPRFSARFSEQKAYCT